MIKRIEQFNDSTVFQVYLLSVLGYVIHRENEFEVNKCSVSTYGLCEVT